MKIHPGCSCMHNRVLFHSLIQNPRNKKKSKNTSGNRQTAKWHYQQIHFNPNPTFPLIASLIPITLGTIQLKPYKHFQWQFIFLFFFSCVLSVDAAQSTHPLRQSSLLFHFIIFYRLYLPAPAPCFLCFSISFDYYCYTRDRDSPSLNYFIFYGMYIFTSFYHYCRFSLYCIVLFKTL